MTRLFTGILAVLTILSLAPPASAASVFHAEGSFTAASGVSYLLFDACGLGATEGIDSNCVALPAGLDGLPYYASMTDTTGLGAPSVCFYDGGGAFMDCDLGYVPFGAASLSITSIVAVQASWSFDVYG